MNPFDDPCEFSDWGGGEAGTPEDGRPASQPPEGKEDTLDEDCSMTARMMVVEGCRAACESAGWLAAQAGGNMRDVALWQAVSGVAAGVAMVAASHHHPVFAGGLDRTLDGVEAGLLLLRAVAAQLRGDLVAADGLAGLAATMAGQAVKEA